MSDVARTLETQYVSRIEFNLDNQTLDTTQPLTSHQQLVEKVEQEIEVLKQLQAIPQQLTDLLIEGAPVRNRIFLQNNEYIEPIFKD